MRQVCLALAVFVAGCATPPQGPVGNTGTIVGEASAPRNRARIHTELATLYYARGNMSVALEELRAAVAADSSYATAHGMFGLVYMELRENALALQSFERALGHAPGDPDINHNYGWFLCQIGREREAPPYFRRALDNPLYATPARTLAAAGICAMRAGDLAAAEDNLQRALRIDPKLPVALLQFAQLRYRQGRFDEARRALVQHAAVAQASAESLWLAVRIERRLGARAAEQSYAIQLRRRFPESPEFQALQSGRYE
ncbi:MAG: type IV pilus biogenesis/stability protein PilW [Betaproteobacteria bacterium]|nr:type IV pilus biogenesis/stability protein PilW [Betaproteobacteria bacterium]